MQEFLLKNFEYVDGELLRKFPVPTCKLAAGTAIGCKHHTGYWRAKIKGRGYQLHRLIWEYHYGAIPEGYEIDHIDTDKNNNRIENLRLLPWRLNRDAAAIIKKSNNTSGCVGVFWHKRQKKWNASIVIDKSKIHLGCFEVYEDAVAARKQAEIDYNRPEIYNQVGNSWATTH